MGKSMKKLEQRSKMNLSSVAPTESVTDESSHAEETKDNSQLGANGAVKPKVIAKATCQTFIPSPNGISGVMAVKLMEEDYVLESTVPPTVDGKSISQTGMFGGTSQQNSSSKKGLQGEDFTGKSVRFHNGRTGTIVAQRPPMAFVICDFGDWEVNKNDDNNSEEEETISILNTRTTISVGNHLFGNIVDIYGNFLDKEQVKSDICDDNTIVERTLFAPIPQVKDIALINSPLLTGCAMVDALTPIGKGQNMLVIGQESGVGQRDFVIGAIRTQLANNNMHSDDDESKKVKCIYALTTYDQNVKEEVIQQLKDAGVLSDIILVTTRDRGTSREEWDKLGIAEAAEAVTVAASACSIAEAFVLAGGEDTFVVIDDIDDYKSFWDWTTRILVDVYGVDSVVKADREGGASSEMRAFYSTLIQRAGRFNKKNGGGSMTLALLANLGGQFGGEDEDNILFGADDFAESSEKVKQRIDILMEKGIPLTSETLRKIQIPLPMASASEQKRRLALQHIDDLVSMSDGHIWFDEILYAKGKRPAIDPQRSITRVGVGADTPCRADAPAMRGLAGGLRFDFAQASSLEGAGKNSGVEKQILKKESYLLAMHQGPGESRTLSENCVALLAASLGLLNSTIMEGGKAGTETGSKAIQGLLNHVWQSSPDSMAEIDQTLDLCPSARSELDTLIGEYFK